MSTVDEQSSSPATKWRSGLLSRDRTSRFVDSIREFDRVDMVTIMTSLLILQHSAFVSDRILTVLVFGAFVIPAVRRSGGFWLLVTGLRFYSQMPDSWSLIDNHQYLVTWWCLALGLVLFASDVERTMRVSARLLIGLCFLFATMWKVRSPDFLNGDFFSWTFTTDSRLRDFAQAFLGFPEDGLTTNYQALRILNEGAIGATELLATGPRVRPMAIAVAWYTVLIEGAVAFLYLLPSKFQLTRFAPWVLLVFIITVYPIAPVVGFALTLLALSVAGDKSSRWWPIVAAFAFALMPLVEYAKDAFDIVG